MYTHFWLFYNTPHFSMISIKFNSNFTKLVLSFVSSTTTNQLHTHSYYIAQFLPIFYFILVSNLLGAIPYSFTNTSQFITTFCLSTIVFISSIFYGIFYNGFKWFDLFLPSGVPFVLAPLLICIELLSFSSRVISLAVRLSANIISGHTLLHMISTGLCLVCNYIVFVIPFLLPVPFVILTALNIIEIGIAILQAYVFILLSLSYFHDSIFLH